MFRQLTMQSDRAETTNFVNFVNFVKWRWDAMADCLILS